MEKNTIKAIAVIAIVIGAFGLTFGYLAMTQPESINPILLLSQLTGEEAAATPQHGVIDTWYTISDQHMNTDSTSFVNITQMNTSIEITGDQNVSLYLHFVGWGSYGGGTGDVHILLRFALDGNGIDPPVYMYDLYSTGWSCLVLQHLIHNVTPGKHSVQVQVAVGNSVSVQIGYSGYEMTLLVQSLIL